MLLFEITIVHPPVHPRKVTSILQLFPLGKEEPQVVFVITKRSGCTDPPDLLGTILGSTNSKFKLKARTVALPVPALVKVNNCGLLPGSYISPVWAAGAHEKAGGGGAAIAKELNRHALRKRFEIFASDVSACKIIIEIKKNILKF